MKSNIRKILQIALTFVMLLSFSLCVACGKDPEPEPNVVSSVERTMRVGEVRYFDFHAVSKGKSYDITVSDESVISVQKDNGKVTALKVGTSEITQTFGLNTASYKITVLESNFVPPTESGESEVSGNPELSIAIPYLKTTVGGVSTVSSIVKFVDTNSLVWSVKDATIAKIVPSADKTTCTIVGLAVGSTEVYLSNGIIKDVIPVEVTAPAPSHAQDANKNTSVKFDAISLNTQVGVTQIVKLVTDLDISGAVWSIVDNATFVTIEVSEDNSEVYVTGASIGTATIRAQIGEYYAECEVSVTADTLEKLGAVSVSITGNTIFWSPVANASAGYEFSTDGGFRWENVSGETTHEIPLDYPSGKYDFMVRAKGDGLNYKAGDYDSVEFVTSLYTDINYVSKSITWKLYDGVSNYTVSINGEEETLTTSDYQVNGEYATATLPSLERNEEIFLVANNKIGNKVYHVSDDLGLVVLYSGIGNSNPSPLLRTNELVSSIVIDNGVERPFVQEDGKVAVQNYDGIEFGKKYPVKVVVGGETVNSNVVFVDRVLFSGVTNYVSPEANFINNENTNYYFKNKSINKTSEKTYEYVANDATELVFTIGDVVIRRSASDLLARKLGEIETVFVRVNEFSVEKVKIGVATAPIENGEQLANLTYVAKGVNTWKNRNCSAVSSHVWTSSNDVIGEDGQIHCPTCDAVWVAGKDRFGKIFSYGQGETFVLKNDIDFFGLRSVYEADGWSSMYSTDASYNTWGFLGTLDGNGYSVYNVSNSLFVLLSNTSVIKNLGVYANISTGNALSRNNINGVVDNCYFDVFVTSQTASAVSAVADIFAKSEGAKAGSLTNSFVNVKIDPNCAQDVYAIGNNIGGADLTNTYVVTTAYNKPTAVSYQGTPSVNVKAVYGEMNQTRIKQFLAQQNVNHGGFINDNGVLKFSYTRPEEVILDELYPLYKHNENYNGRVANTDDLVLDGYTIPASTFTGVTPGNVVSVVLERSDERVVTANVKVVTGVISTAQELSGLIYLSSDGTPANPWGGYYVLADNIDMAGYTMAKTTSPGNLANSGSYGFQGTIDGEGHTIFNLNDFMFWQLGNWVGTIKNLSLINMSRPLANCLGGLTIDNCYFQFVFNDIYQVTTDKLYVYDHVLGHSVGDSYPRDVVISNSVIEVINNTETEVSIIEEISPMTRTEPEYAGRVSTLTYRNTILVANTNKVKVGATYNDSTPAIVEEGTAYTGDVSGFNEVMWNKEGNFPTFNSFIYKGEVENKFTYGRYVTVDGVRVENSAAFVGKVDEGVIVTWDGAKDYFLTKDGKNNFTKSPGEELETMLKGSDGKYYKVTIVLSSVAINTADDLKNLMISLAGVDNYTPGSGQVVMLNDDIDMSGVKDIVYSKSGAAAIGWGFQGTFDGNGYTISNLEVPLFSHTNSACVIKNVTFKNIKEGGAVTDRSSGATLQNVKFDIDASEIDTVYVFAKDSGARGVLSMTDCVINVSNATDTTNIYVQGGLTTYVSEAGSMTINNVEVTTNAGNFAWANANATDALNRTGAINGVRFDGTVTHPGA